MILDGFLAWSINQSASAWIVGANVSTNIIDLGEVSGIPSSAQGGGARDIGIGDDPAMKILVQVTAAFNAPLTTLQATIQGAPDNGSGAPGAFVNWYSDAAPVAVANLTVGMRLLDMDMPRPAAGAPVPRYLQLSYAAAGGSSSTGQISAFLVLDRWDQMYNANFVNVPGGYVPGVVVNN